MRRNKIILSLRVECVWGMNLRKECVRFIEIDDGASLLDLHGAIQASVGFDDDHMFEFFAGRTYRNRNMVFGGDDDREASADAMGEITLAQVYPLPKSLKLYYHFDFGDDWFFEIRKGRQQAASPLPGVKYPRVVERIGRNPVQYGEYDEE